MSVSYKSKVLTWIDARLPLTSSYKKYLSEYYAPKNLNFWYFFGVLSLVVLVNQLVTGIWLTMYYTPTDTDAFASIQLIMRDVQYGWLLRYMHSTGASAFFVVVYLHMYRGLMYGSYQKPRELLWLFGMLIYTLLLMEAFTGYVLPWGQMSYWATQVITSLFEVIPIWGKDITIWIRGDYYVSGVSLHRFFSFHVAIIPMAIVLTVLLHLVALRTVGSANPEGIEIKEHKNAEGIPLDGIPFHPYFTVKDLFGIVVFLFICCLIIFYSPEFGGYFLEPENFSPANPRVTPEHIAPIWYMTPFYAILRAIPNKLLGATLMAGAVAILWVLPWLDRSPVKSIRYKGNASKCFLTVFVVSFIALGYLGLVPLSTTSTWLARIFTIGYFSFFLLMPFYTRREAIKKVPERIKQ